MNISRACTLRGGERVVCVVREHAVPLLRSLLLPTAFVAAPFFVMYPLFLLGSPGKAAFIVSVASGLALAARVVHRWYWNTFIITDRRVVDVDQRGMFDRVVSEAPFDRIEHVAYRVRGLLGHVFRYGNVTVRSMGSGAELVLERVPRPKDVHELIAGLLEDRQELRDKAPRAGIGAAVRRMYDGLDQ